MKMKEILTSAGMPIQGQYNASNAISNLPYGMVGRQ